jgi:hypothetical protein
MGTTSLKSDVVALILEIQDLGLLVGKTFDLHLVVEIGFRHTTGESFVKEEVGDNEKETATEMKAETKIARTKNVLSTIVLPIFHSRFVFLINFFPHDTKQISGQVSVQRYITAGPVGGQKNRVDVEPDSE